LIEKNIHDEMACNGKEHQICEIVNLLAVVALMFRIEEQGEHSCCNCLFSCNVFMSSNLDFFFLLFVLNALFLALLELLVFQTIQVD